MKLLLPSFPNIATDFYIYDLGLKLPNCNDQAEYAAEALDISKISDRKVCVRWWKLGRWLHGFRMRDESHSRCVSLLDLAIEKDNEVLGVLHRGAVHEVLRVQISVANPTHTPWSCPSMEMHN